MTADDLIKLFSFGTVGGFALALFPALIGFGIRSILNIIKNL